MASTSYISGMSSGLDWTSMISSLVALEHKPITKLENSKSTLSSQKSAWNELNTNLLALKTSANSLSSSNDFDVFSSSSSLTGSSKSASDLMSFAVGSDASEGSYEITVNQLATAEKLKSTAAITSTSEARGISGTVDINGRTLSIDATDSLANIRDKINALNSGDNPADVTASIITVAEGDYRLTLTAKNTGADGISLDNDSATDILTTGFGLQQLTAGQDAQINIDGEDITRSTNQITDVIEGVTIKLVGEDDPEETSTITLNINRDTDGVKKKIQDFVDKYNKVMSSISTQNTVSSDGKTTGTLFGDSSLRSVKTSLREALFSEVSGLNSSLDHLSLIGVNIDRYGKLSINEDTLDGYLETNFNDVRNLFVAQGTSSNSNLAFAFAASESTASEGDYEVEITQTATRAEVTGSGFSGTLGSAATLTLTSAGGTVQTISLSAGAGMDAIVESINEGNTLGITAENDGGQLKLSSTYGSSGNFTVSGISTELGVADGSHSGVDVAGRIRMQGETDWISMTGKGQNLSGDNDTGVEGLYLAYSGTSTGTFDFTYTKGVGQKLDEALYSMTSTVDGSIAGKQKSLQTQMDNIDKKITAKEESLTRYEESLKARFARMESMLSTLQSQQSWLTSQISSLSS
jgi:flagellar hook-associated protein 2